MIGGALATVILFVFLRSWVTTLVVGLAIPFSLLAAAALLRFTGRTLNILSMMGLMLAVGMLVDNAVVVLESIFRHRQKGLGPLRAALVGSREVLPAVVCSTATSIIVFLPLVLGGRTEISTWIGEVGRTIIFTLLCSLFLSLTAIPLALGRILPARPVPQTRLVAAIAGFHQRALRWTLAHRPATVGIALLVVVSAGLAFTKVDKSAFTASRVEAVTMNYEFADNLNHREVERLVAKVERWMGARKDSLHLKSTYSYFTNNFAFTRGYLIPTYQNDEGSSKVKKRLRGLALASTDGGSVPLGAVTDFRVVRTPQSIERQQRHSVRTVNASCDPKKAGQIRKSISRELSAMSFPTGYWWSYGQGYEEEDATQKEMLVNLVLALMLVYLVMASLFESLLHPFAIMLALPFA